MVDLMGNIDFSSTREKVLEQVNQASKTEFEELVTRINEKNRSFNSLAEFMDSFRLLEELHGKDPGQAESLALDKEYLKQIAVFLDGLKDDFYSEEEISEQRDIIENCFYKLRLKTKASKGINQELRELSKARLKNLAQERNIKRIPLTRDDLLDKLEKAKITIKENLITHEIEYSVPPLVKKSWGLRTEHIANDISIYLKDVINTSLEYSKTTKTEIDDYLQVIGHGNAYNPLEELLERTTWDGSDRWTELFDIMGLDDELSKTLLKKWLYQTISQALFNGSDKYKLFGADGIIVLQGSQGIGKTRTVQLLDPFRNTVDEAKYIHTGGKYSGKVKDTLIQSTAYLITELGELERTLKKEVYDDTGDFKSFVTDPIDEYRKHYDKRAEKHPRKTGFIGTVNREDFLIDETGNRRFYTISVEHIDLKAFEEFKIAQLWKQAFIELTEYQEKTGKAWQSIFRLTADERSELNHRNTSYEALMPGEAELMDIIANYETNPDGYVMALLTVTYLKDHFQSLQRYNTRQLGSAMKKIKDRYSFIEFRPKGRAYLFPVYQNSLTSEELELARKNKLITHG